MGDRRVGAGLLLSLVLAACSVTPATPAALTPPPAAPDGLDPDHALVVAEELGGPTFIMDTFDPRSVTLYADGTLVAPGPGGILLPTVGTTLDATTLDQAWALVLGSGLAIDRTLDLPGLFDAGTTEMRVDDGSTLTRLAVYALGAEPADGEPTFAPDEAGIRAAASHVLARLRELSGTDPWTPPAMLLWWGPSEDAPSGMPPAHLVPWTAPVDLAGDGAAVDNPLFTRCLRLEGDAVPAVAQMVRSLPSDVVVEHAGARYGIGVRPIYPDEVDAVACP